MDLKEISDKKKYIKEIIVFFILVIYLHFISFLSKMYNKMFIHKKLKDQIPSEILVIQVKIVIRNA